MQSVEGEIELLTDNPSELKDGMITELHTRALEKMIQENPQFWLWSHKRWKRKMTDKEKLADKAGICSPFSIWILG